MPFDVRPGRHAPLGATLDDDGVNFALVAENAEAVDLCLFDEGLGEQRIRLPEVTDGVWHGYVTGIGAGTRYGFRVSGPYDPGRGRRFNPLKLLIDPYARAIDGAVDCVAETFGYDLAASDGDLSMSRVDDASVVPKSVVVDGSFDWRGDTPPRTPWEDTILYETHVKGFTQAHPGIPEPVRGTYAGLAHPAAIEHLQTLGVTTVELLPVHHFVTRKFLLDKGLRNYWGYDSIGYFAPHSAYSASGSRGGQVRDFKEMVRALHAAGIEVILDVVYNHTGEGDELGATVGFRGIDNQVYYRLVDGGRRYADFTGTGNSLDVRHPAVLRLIVDSLRYWVTEMHVDGFRFDLASTLARGSDSVEPSAPFFDAIRQDPVLSQTKLIAEPWDLGAGGYQVGSFPAGWSEWNDKYRDVVRDFWRGAGPSLAEVAARLTGSPDLYRASGRAPSATVNFVTAHDGFTLTDLVSYDSKHNGANGEHGRDGADHNRSWNCGVEGPTDDPAVNALRRQQKRNFLTTLALSHGVPMVLGGDEFGRTQGGNNNAYCQDNEISWYDWAQGEESAALLRFARRVLALRRSHRVFHRDRWLDERDVTWFDLQGDVVVGSQWEQPGLKAFAVQLSDDEGSSFLLLFNAAPHPERFRLPAASGGGKWGVVIDTSRPDLEELVDVRSADDGVEVESRSIVVLRRLDG